MMTVIKGDSKILGPVLVGASLLALMACSEPQADTQAREGDAPTEQAGEARQVEASPEVDPAELTAKARAYREANIAFVTENAKRDGWRVTETGLQIKDLKVGEGATPTRESVLEAQFKLSLPDGTVMHDSFADGKPMHIPAGKVVPGWVEGVSDMREGGRRQLVIPNDLAYGAREVDDIPPHSALIIDVELLRVMSFDELYAERKAKQEDFIAQQTVYLEENAKKPGVKVMPSGLQIEVLKSGPADGLKPLKTSKAEVHYTGRLTDGRLIDSTRERDETLFTHPTQLIKGWEEALLMMRPGDEWRVTIPHQLGYGLAGFGIIPPQATLIYEVEVIEVYNGLEGIPSREWMKIQAEKEAADKAG